MSKHNLLLSCRSRTVAISPQTILINLHSRYIATTTTFSQAHYTPTRAIPTYLLPSQNQWRPQRALTPYLRHSRTTLAAFNTSAVVKATVATLNPQVDEDGQPLLISISPRAAKRLREITDPAASPSATQKENPYHHLRITVTSGGCHGFQYLMSLEPSSKISEEEDTVFEIEEDTPPDAAPGAAAGQAKVVMDSASLELLSGSTVDYTTELIGSQFKIVDNPRASSNCGCGTSFDIKE
ncbi:iron-sulfur cluster assembly accessory protein [Trichophyton tonsurans CBS 112818]|uniref:Iron-sulfur cluster assembly accessory protein I n=2 Tax=Trichophyton TaxID=5550 RepID=F2PNV1_TRIEC|nr:iron-sulfur cluster assembly accessory protein [Trichophyton tonsurans CBS 112818]EGE03569.1 iron-sulfur cluster assembly accessory protein I [Trichophyton equinum CBS 127.97]